MTDDAGRFALEVPAAASYVLFAQAKQNRDSLGRTDVATFYPDAPDPFGAVPVAADSADPAAGLDIKLRKARPGSVRIRIAGSLTAGRPDQETVQPLIGLNLRSVAFDWESALRFPPVPAGPDTFEFRNLPPGRYVAYAIVPAKELRAAYTAINLPEAQGVERTLAMAAGLDISGHASGVTAEELKSVRVSLTPIDSPAAGMLSGRVDSSGNFMLPGIAPGHYAVSVAGLRDGMVVRSVSFGGKGAQSGEIDVPAAADLSIDLTDGTQAASGAASAHSH